MKTFTKLTLLFIFSAISNFGMSVVNIYNSTSLSDLSIASDVIIHSPAVLTLSGDMVLAPGVTITVKDGAKLVCTNGHLRGMVGEENWGGIKVECTLFSNPAADYGVYMTNFTLRDADVAIDSGYRNYMFGEGENPVNSHNRRMYFNNVIFENNRSHFLLFNAVDDLVLGSITIGKVRILMNNCQFKNCTDAWPIHVLKSKHLAIYNSQFAMNPPNQMCLHFHTLTNGKIDNCDFSQSNVLYPISIHGATTNSTISNSTFRIYKNNSIGIEFNKMMAAQSENLLISGNDFYRDTLLTSNFNVTGIGGFDNSYLNFVHSGMRIENNSFTNLTTGVRSFGLTEGSKIQLNEFIACDYGLEFLVNNPDLKIECNEFDCEQNDIKISTGASVANQTNGYDPSNTFTLGICNIENLGAQTFQYHKLSTSSISSCGTNTVSFVPTNTTKNCSTGGTGPIKDKALISGGFNDTEIVIYPNPANEYIELSNKASEIDNIEICTLDGKVLIKKNLSFEDSSDRIEVSTLNQGTYLSNFYSNKTLVTQKLLIIE